MALPGFQEFGILTPKKLKFIFLGENHLKNQFLRNLKNHPCVVHIHVVGLYAKFEVIPSIFDHQMAPWCYVMMTLTSITIFEGSEHCTPKQNTPLEP